MSLAAEILAMVRDALPGVAVYDGRVPDGVDLGAPGSRYVVAYIAIPRVESETVAAESTSGTVHWQTTCVAPDREMAAWLAERVRDALVDRRPMVDGWQCGQIEHVASQLPRSDEQVQERPVLLVTDQYRLIADRLPAGVQS